jgi:predicted nucleic acid-binding protein
VGRAAAALRRRDHGAALTPALLDTVPAGASILVDTSVLLAHLSPWDPVGVHATTLIEGCMLNGRNPGAISAVSVGELLVRPHRHGPQAVDAVLGFLWSIPELFIRSVDFLVAAEAARMRAMLKMAVPDSLILATGVLIGADVLATNDRDLAAAARSVAPGITSLVLADLGG